MTGIQDKSNYCTAKAQKRRAGKGNKVVTFCKLIMVLNGLCSLRFHYQLFKIVCYVNQTIKKGKIKDVISLNKSVE